MALIKCPGCEKDVSENAESCPSCGEPIKGKEKDPDIVLPPLNGSKPMSTKKKGCLGCLGIFFLMAFFGSLIDDTKTTQKIKSSETNPTPISRAFLYPTKTLKPTPNPTPTSLNKDLKSSVKYSDGKFTITNFDTFDWLNVKLELNGGTFKSGYIYKTNIMDGGGIYTVGSMAFAKKDGTKFNPFQMKPMKMVITCDLKNGGRGFSYGEWQ